MSDVEQILKAANAVAFILGCAPEEIERAMTKQLRVQPIEIERREQAYKRLLAELEESQKKLRGLTEQLARAEASIGRRRKERLVLVETPITSTPGFDLNQRTQSRYNRACRNAYLRGIGWAISPADYERLASMACDYCLGATGSGVGLDRLDAKKGYVVANVVPCCGKCNVIRGTRLTPEQMRVAMAALR